MIISMMGVMSRFASTSSSTKWRSQDANCGVNVLLSRVSVDLSDIGVSQGYLFGSMLHSFGL